MAEARDYLIIGNGVSGMTAAENLRQEDPGGSILIVSNESHPLYSRVLLPNYVKGVIPREKVFLRTPEDYASKHIELVNGTAVTLDIGNRSVHLEDGRDFKFGKLLIASGGSPRPLEMREEEMRGVSRFQTIEDADRIREFVPKARSGLVVGGSFIALEYLEVLCKGNVPATLLFRGEHFFEGHLDPAGARLLEENFRAHGVREIIRGDDLVGLEGEASLTAAKTGRGRMIACDFLGIGVGIEKNIGWLRESGLTLTSGGVFVNEFLETPVPGIFAAGDVADFYDVISGEHHSRGNWANAFLQGKAAGWNMAHSDAPQAYRAVAFYSITNLGFAITFVGRTLAAPADAVVVRYQPGDSRYARFVLSGGRLAGAVLINRPTDRASVSKLIELATPLQDSLAELADPDHELASLLPA